jgi:hypothetical protein
MKTFSMALKSNPLIIDFRRTFVRAIHNGRVKPGSYSEAAHIYTPVNQSLVARWRWLTVGGLSAEAVSAA